MQIRRSGDFTPEDAEDLAKVINYGALPGAARGGDRSERVADAREDQLAAGIAAGIIGLLLVALYMLVYYRLLGAGRDRRAPRERGGLIVRTDLVPR